jgi:probable rRNA maturation factor
MAEAEGASLVDLVIEDARWEAGGFDAVAERAAAAVLVAVGRVPRRHELALLMCDDARIAVLNAEFRGKAVPTNVLSWPAFAGEPPEPGAGPSAGPGARDEPLFLGDVAMAYETCAREAEAAGVPLGDHAAHLVIHGVLHLLGHDHVGAAEAEAMEDLETKTLATLGIADPYSR